MSTPRAAVCKKLALSATATQADIYRAALKKIGAFGGRVSPENPPKVGDRIVLSHGEKCSGVQSPVLAVSAHGFTVQCAKCGDRLNCSLQHGYQIV